MIRNAYRRLKSSALCRRDVPISSAWQAIGWWESRRVPFNLIVASSGMLSGLIIGVVALGSFLFFNSSELGWPGSPLFAVIGLLGYVIMANVCFTGGWLAELVVRKAWPPEADRFATFSFSCGLVFSVLLTLMPGFLIGALGIIGLFAHLFRSVH